MSRRLPHISPSPSLSLFFSARGTLRLFLTVYSRPSAGIGHLIVIYPPALYDPSALDRARETPRHKLAL